MSTFSNIVSIAKSFSTLAGAVEDASKVYDILTGNDGMSAVINAINSLENLFSQGMAQVVAAVNDNTYQAQWNVKVQQLDDIQSAYLPVLEQLGTLTSDHKVVLNGVEMSLVQWCETGNGTGTDSGALTILFTQLNALGNLFKTGGTTADPTLLSIWQNVCQAAAANEMAGFVGQTQYTLTFAFMQQIFGIIGAIAFAHEGALALYKAEKPKNPHNFVSVKPLVASLFGNVNAAGTVWNAFGSQLNSALTPGDPLAQYGICMTSCDNGAAATPFNPTGVLGNSAFEFTAAFYVCNAQLVAPAGSYFGGLRLRVAPAFNPIETLSEAMLYVQGMPVAIGANLEMTPSAWLGEPQAVINGPPTGPYFDVIPYVMYPGSDEIAYFNTSYTQLPTAPGPTQYSVITGFQLTLCYGNRIGLAVQYSTLDLSNPASPMLSTPAWIQPDPSGPFFAIGGWDNWPITINAADTRPAGTSDYLPATNATIVASHPTGDQGTCIGVALQNALSLHTLPWLQADAAFGPDTSVPAVKASAPALKTAPAA